MKILVKITKDVLEKTKMCSNGFGGNVTQNCAISYAVREIFPNAHVETQEIFFDVPHDVFMWTERCVLKNVFPYTDLPPIASEFIEVFDKSSADARTQMEPISFEIDVPSSLIDSINIGDVYKILSESKTLNLVEI